MSGMMGPASGLTKGKLELATAQPDEVYRGKTYYGGDSKELRTGTLAVDQATAAAGDVISGKTFYAGSKARKTGTLVERPAITTATSISSAKTGQPYFRFPQGAYRRNASSGYPEVTASRANILNAMNLNFSGNWECIGFGSHAGDMGTGVYNAQNYITWANGWSRNLPQGTYRVIVCFGQGSTGSVHVNIYLNNTNNRVGHEYGVYWNYDDCQFTGSGNLIIAYSGGDLADRNPSGVTIVVLHKR